MAAKDIVAIALSTAALIVSATSFILNYRHNRRAAVLARKPVLVFECDGATGWILRNVGSGPALNILVAQQRPGAQWLNPVRIPPLSKDGKFVAKWLGHVNTTGLGALYTDFEAVAYTATCGNDLSEVSEGRRFGPWAESEIARHWDNPPLVE